MLQPDMPERSESPIPIPGNGKKNGTPSLKKRQEINNRQSKPLEVFSNYTPGYHSPGTPGSRKARGTPTEDYLATQSAHNRTRTGTGARCIPR